MNRNLNGQGNFWSRLPRPFFAMAPMANVTDCVFRKLFAKYGKPDVMFTEFVSADGLVSAGRERLLIDLKFSPKERPMVAQLFTGHPDAMREAAALVAKIGFDGLDINMGCPDRAVERQGGGAAMMKDQKTAIEVLEAARIGVKEILNPKSEILPAAPTRQRGEDKSEIRNSKSKEGYFQSIPVSVKTRIGYNKVDLNWIRLLIEHRLPALTIHLRTRKEMSDVPAHWELMPEIIKMRDEIQADIDSNQRTLVIGNGDVASLEDAVFKCKKYSCDGVMIGRGIFGAPWFFENIEKIRNSKFETLPATPTRQRGEDKSKIRNQKSDLTNKREKTPKERLNILVEHAKLFEKEFCGKVGKGARKRPVKSFAVMRKHFKAYVSGWDGAKELRAKLMETENAEQVSKIVKGYLSEAHKR